MKNNIIYSKLALIVLILISLTVSARAEYQWSIVDHTNSELLDYETGTSVYEDSDGLTWLLCSQGVYVYNDDTFVAKYDPDGMGFPDCEGYIWANQMCESSNGTKYIATGQGLAVFDGDNWIIYDTENAPMESYCCMDISIDADDTVWIVTLKEVLTLDQSGNWQVYNGTNTPMHPTYAKLQGMAVDSNGTKWFLGRKNGEENPNGLISFDGTTWTGHAIDSAPANPWWSGICVTDEDVIWLTSFNHIFSYDIADGTSEDHTDDAGTEKTMSCFFDETTQEVWFGQTVSNDQRGVLKYNGTEWTRYGSSDDLFQINNNTYDITSDNSGNIWFSQNDAGFVKLDKEPLGIEDQNLTATVELMQNYPNPFNPATTINFINPSNGHVKLSVYNVKGEMVANLVNANMSSGTKAVNFNASSLNSGVYYYTLQANGMKVTKKMMLVK